MTEQQAEIIGDKLLEIIESHYQGNEEFGFDMMIFQDNDPNENVWDDGTLHLTRNGWRWCLGVGQGSRYEDKGYFERFASKQLDKLLNIKTQL